MKRACIAVTILALFVYVGPAQAALVVTVPGKSTVYFAGQTAGDMPLSASGYDYKSNVFHGDGNDSSTLPPSIDVTGFGGTIPGIVASGQWGFGASYQEGPAGGAFTQFGTNGVGTSHAEYDDLGISLLTAPYNGLAGVFLGGGKPAAPAPSPLSTLAGHDMTTPALQQSFYIGESLSNITVPSGATRLFFGLHNGHEWNNNVGSLTLQVVPEPASLAVWGVLGGLGLAGVWWRRRRGA